MVDPSSARASLCPRASHAYQGIAMFGRNQISDKDLQKTVNHRLQRTGASSQSRIAATVQGGMVTLTGTIQYANQRTPIVKAVSNIAGIRRVVDQLQMAPPKPQH
jgi:osmotically-inducible protein OsmY